MKKIIILIIFLLSSCNSEYSIDTGYQKYMNYFEGGWKNTDYGLPNLYFSDITWSSAIQMYNKNKSLEDLVNLSYSYRFNTPDSKNVCLYMDGNRNDAHDCYQFKIDNNKLILKNKYNKYEYTKIVEKFDENLVGKYSYNGDEIEINKDGTAYIKNRDLLLNIKQQDFNIILFNYNFISESPFYIYEIKDETLFLYPLVNLQRNYNKKIYYKLTKIK